jgi:hypothetical protein
VDNVHPASPIVPLRDPVLDPLHLIMRGVDRCGDCGARNVIKGGVPSDAVSGLALTKCEQRDVLYGTLADIFLLHSMLTHCDFFSRSSNSIWKLDSLGGDGCRVHHNYS